MFSSVWLLAWLSCLLFASARVLTPLELATLPRPGGLVVSPNGKRAVYPQSVYDADLDKTATHLSILDTGLAGSVKQLTEPVWGASDNEPLFLDDTHLAFLHKSADHPTPQLYVIDLTDADQKPYALSDFPIAVSSLKYNVAQKILAFSAAVYEGGTLQETKDKDDQLQKTKKDSALVFDRLMVRHWDEFVSEKKNNIFVIHVDRDTNGKYSLADEPRNLLAGSGLESPTKPFGDASDYDFSLDGNIMAFVAKIKSVESAWQTSQHVYLVSTAGGEAPRAINDDIPAASSKPVFAPSGVLAYLQMMVPGYESDRNRIVVYDPSNGDKRVVTPEWDRSPSDLVFGPHSDVLYVTAEENGRQKIFSVDMEGEAVALTQSKSASGLSVASAANKLLFMSSSMQHPAMPHSLDLTTGSLNPLGVAPNLASRLTPIEMAKPQEFEFKGALGDRVHGWLLMPAGYDRNKTYPVAFLIHGGPQGSWIDNWSTRWNPQVFAAKGYAVVAINPHGSTGYGQKFTDAIRRNWGSYPYWDLDLGLDYVFETYPFLDADRLVGLGASYGGYMINWINGHSTRFKALVNHDGMFSSISSYYATDELYFAEREFGGVPFNPIARITYERFSPSNYVSQWKTPTLVIHGAHDYRLVDGEALSTFTALQRQGIPSRLLYFPDENHWVLKHANSLRWHKEVFQWIDHWTSHDTSSSFTVQ